MRVLSQVISAPSCERNWSAHGRINAKIRNRLDPALRSLSIFTQTAKWWHQLAMLTSSRCLLGTMKMFRFCTVAAGWTGPGAEAPKRRSAHFEMSGAEARGASRGSAPRRASANPAQSLPPPLPLSRYLVLVVTQPLDHTALNSADVPSLNHRRASSPIRIHIQTRPLSCTCLFGVIISRPHPIRPLFLLIPRLQSVCSFAHTFSEPAVSQVDCAGQGAAGVDIRRGGPCGGLLPVHFHRGSMRSPLSPQTDCCVALYRAYGACVSRSDVLPRNNRQESQFCTELACRWS